MNIARDVRKAAFKVNFCIYRKTVFSVSCYKIQMFFPPPFNSALCRETNKHTFYTLTVHNGVEKNDFYAHINSYKFM